MIETIERRFISTDLRVERRDDAPAAIFGHAAVFNQLSEDLGGFREKVLPGAFADTIMSDDIRALFNHNPSMIIGRNRAGTLKLREDTRGLAFEITPPDTQTGRDLLTSIERGDITGNSFGFQAIDASWDVIDGEEVRSLAKVRLLDVSPVTYPAYPQTDLALRSLEAWRSEQHTAHRRLVRERQQALLTGEALAG